MFSKGFFFLVFKRWDCVVQIYSVLNKEYLLNKYLAPGYPSEYLFVRQEPKASITARLAKFWKYSVLPTEFEAPTRFLHCQLVGCIGV